MFTIGWENQTLGCVDFNTNTVYASAERMEDPRFLAAWKDLVSENEKFRLVIDKNQYGLSHRQVSHIREHCMGVRSEDWIEKVVICVNGVTAARSIAALRSLGFFVDGTEEPDHPVVSIEAALESSSDEKNAVLNCFYFDPELPSDFSPQAVAFGKLISVLARFFPHSLCASSLQNVDLATKNGKMYLRHCYDSLVVHYFGSVLERLAVNVNPLFQGDYYLANITKLNPHWTLANADDRANCLAQMERMRTTGEYVTLYREKLQYLELAEELSTAPQILQKEKQIELLSKFQSVFNAWQASADEKVKQIRSSTDVFSREFQPR